VRHCLHAANATCIVDINECASNPCLHNGTCLDRVNHIPYTAAHSRGLVCPLVHHRVGELRAGRRLLIIVLATSVWICLLLYLLYFFLIILLKRSYYCHITVMSKSVDVAGNIFFNWHLPIKSPQSAHCHTYEKLAQNVKLKMDSR